MPRCAPRHSDGPGVAPRPTSGVCSTFTPRDPVRMGSPSHPLPGPPWGWGSPATSSPGPRGDGGPQPPAPWAPVGMGSPSRLPAASCAHSPLLWRSDVSPWPGRAESRAALAVGGEPGVGLRVSLHSWGFVELTGGHRSSALPGTQHFLWELRDGYGEGTCCTSPTRGP